MSPAPTFTFSHACLISSCYYAYHPALYASTRLNGLIAGSGYTIPAFPAFVPYFTRTFFRPPYPPSHTYHAPPLAWHALLPQRPTYAYLPYCLIYLWMVHPISGTHVRRMPVVQFIAVYPGVRPRLRTYLFYYAFTSSAAFDICAAPPYLAFTRFRSHIPTAGLRVHFPTPFAQTRAARPHWRCARCASPQHAFTTPVRALPAHLPHHPAPCALPALPPARCTRFAAALPYHAASRLRVYNCDGYHAAPLLAFTPYHLPPPPPGALATPAMTPTPPPHTLRAFTPVLLPACRVITAFARDYRLDGLVPFFAVGRCWFLPRRPYYEHASYHHHYMDGYCILYNAYAHGRRYFFFTRTYLAEGHSRATLPGRAYCSYYYTWFTATPQLRTPHCGCPFPTATAPPISRCPPPRAPRHAFY